MRYEFVDDIRSDVKFRAYGKDLKEVFENAAIALSEVFCDVSKIGNTKKILIQASADNEKLLIVEWLTQIIAAVDIDEMFFCNFGILEIDEKHVKAYAYGDDIKPELGGTVAKAVTNYDFKFEKTAEGYVLQAVVDI